MNSSFLREARYDEKTRTLTIELARGGSYVHQDVPKEVYEDLMRAASPGRFYNSEIKGVY